MGAVADIMLNFLPGVSRGWKPVVRRGHLRYTRVLIAVTSLALFICGYAPRASADPSPAQQQQAAELSRRASDLIDRGKLSEAESTLRQSLSLVPAHPTRLYNLACVLAGEGKTADAMGALERATDAGFTDFTLLAHNRTLAVLHDSPRYDVLLGRKDQIVHRAAELGLTDLRRQLSDGYLYDTDERHKLIFAVAVDQPTLAMLESDLQIVEAVEEREVFSHPPDEFIRIALPSEADFSRMAPVPHLGGDYEDTTRTVVSMRLGQFMTHEFTHALHAADQHAIGQEHPVWLSEGLASLYESAEIDGTKLIAHDNSRLKFVRYAAKSGGLVPLEKLLRMTRQDFNARPNLAYGQASGLLRYLQEAGLLKPFYDAYIAGYAKDPTGATALEQTTGSTLPAIQKAFSQWIQERPEPPTPLRAGGPLLGVGIADAIDGVRITNIPAERPALSADIKVGDVMVAMDGKELRDRAALERLLAPHESGQQALLRLRRGKEYVERTITLGGRTDHK